MTDSLCHAAHATVTDGQHHTALATMTDGQCHAALARSPETGSGGHLRLAPINLGQHKQCPRASG